MSDSDSEDSEMPRREKLEKVEVKSPIVPKLNLENALPLNWDSLVSFKEEEESKEEIKEEINPFIKAVEIKEDVKLIEEKLYKPI